MRDYKSANLQVSSGSHSGGTQRSRSSIDFEASDAWWIMRGLVHPTQLLRLALIGEPSWNWIQ